MNNYNVIGDIAGNYKTMLALIEKMPPDAVVLSLGDINDRGPRSKEVIEYFASGKGKLVQSNHAHMMVDCWKRVMMPGAQPQYYDDGIWSVNGGKETLLSYGDSMSLIPESHIRFLEQCPMFIETPDFIMTHAPIPVDRSPEEASKLGHGFNVPFYDQDAEYSCIWNRWVPKRVNPQLNGKVNVFGHNASDMVKVWNEEFPGGIKTLPETFTKIWANREQCPIWAIDLDTSFGSGLTGLHLPSMQLYEQEFIE